MEAHIQALRINRNPLNLVLGTKRKLGLRIGYMEAALKGFYLNSIETGVHPQKLTRLLSEEFHCVDTESTNGLLQFLTNEGDRVPYQIMLPYLLSSDNINEFETIIHKRFFGVERFVRQGNNLYRFVKYTEERRDPIIWINDLERGIDAWDMGILVNLARAAYEIGYITKGQAWEHIELAGYAFFINDRTKDTVLLDYFAIVPEKRSSGIGSEFLGKIKEKIADSGNRLILEVENPEYAEDGPAKDYMIKRIGFYKKNDMNLSGVSCNFYDNEYRILYAGEFMDDEEVYNRTHSVYLDFMGEELDSRCVFH